MRAPIVITDANIIIDLSEGGIIPAFFRLPYDVHISSLVLSEVIGIHRNELQPYLDGGQLKRESLNEDETREIRLMSATYNRLSVPDCSALFLSRKLNGTLLTGDNKLRTTAEQGQVNVHGTLFVLDELILHGLLTTSEAADKLKQLIGSGSHLPQKACTERLNKWEPKHS